MRNDNSIEMILRGVDSEIPPVYTIDLSLPPAQRYVQVAEEFKSVLVGLPELFDDLLDEGKVPRKPIHILCRLVLRKLHSNEQTEELRGISNVIGVPMYLLVAYNVLLDLFMGCTSGGVMVKERGSKEKKMMHFRTLDWGMARLKQAVVQFEFKEHGDGPIVARTVGYVGFVGVLTGVRQGLSVSLNFRPYHNDDSSLWTNFKYRAHQLFVLLGWRPSITAHLRDCILPTKNNKRHRLLEKCQDLGDIAKWFPLVKSTAAYLIFCDGVRTLILEKDRCTAKALLSSSFITVTNHDTSYEDAATDDEEAHADHSSSALAQNTGIGMQDIVDESIDRKKVMVKQWEGQCRRFGTAARANDNAGVHAGMDMLKRWLGKEPVTNEDTHFVTIMDPTEGTFVWVKRFPYVEGEEYIGTDEYESE